MFTDPFIIFLDEPTTGVDPKSRRFVWNCIKSLQCQGRTIVLTSHSMDECEMLCNRLGIMKNGEFKCIGYIQKLKEKYGRGFSLMVKMKPRVPQNNDDHVDQASRDLTDSVPSLMESITDIKLQLQSLFTCDLKDEHEVLMTLFRFLNNFPFFFLFRVYFNISFMLKASVGRRFFKTFSNSLVIMKMLSIALQSTRQLWKIYFSSSVASK